MFRHKNFCVNIKDSCRPAYETLQYTFSCREQSTLCDLGLRTTIYVGYEHLKGVVLSQQEIDEAINNFVIEGPEMEQVCFQFDHEKIYCEWLTEGWETKEIVNTIASVISKSDLIMVKDDKPQLCKLEVNPPAIMSSDNWLEEYEEQQRQIESKQEISEDDDKPLTIKSIKLTKSMFLKVYFSHSINVPLSLEDKEALIENVSVLQSRAAYDQSVRFLPKLKKLSADPNSMRLLQSSTEKSKPEDDYEFEYSLDEFQGNMISFKIEFKNKDVISQTPYGNDELILTFQNSNG